MSKDIPAFPFSGYIGQPGESEGMTLRDYFATKAMQAITATPEGFTVSGAHDVANISYELADAMLEARES